MSKPVSIELDGLFKAFDISSVEEVTLGKVPLNTLGLQFYIFHLTPVITLVLAIQILMLPNDNKLMYEDRTTVFLK